MEFTLMHGCGNRFVVVDCLHGRPPELAGETEAEVGAVAREVCRGSRGVGADGLILVEPSSVAVARMTYFNADGSPAGVCGNGLRCVVKWLHDRGLCRDEPVLVETACGVREAWVERRQSDTTWVRVDMGTAVLDPQRIPVRCPAVPPLDWPLRLQRPKWAELTTVRVSTLSMGNPHCVVSVEQLAGSLGPNVSEDELVHTLGPEIERHPAFPERTNVEFVWVEGRRSVRVRVWERGVGETLACGTGACAVAVACALQGLTDPQLSVRMPGGTLTVDCRDRSHVLLCGPAAVSLVGQWPRSSD